MLKLEQIKHRINKRPILILLHGKSIVELEDNIIQMKDLDVCYCSINYFTLLEEHILNRIDRRLDFVYDSSFIPVEYRQNFECKYRIPRLRGFLDSSPEKFYVTTKGSLERMCLDTGNEEFIIKYENQIFLIDNLPFNLNAPNSAILLVGLCIAFEISLIALLGFDGFKGVVQNDLLHSYYKSELYIKNHRYPSVGNLEPSLLSIETLNIESRGLGIVQQYCRELGVFMPEIYNCSPSTIYTGLFDIITYKILINKLKEKRWNK